MTDISDDFIPECISLPGGNNLAEAQQLRQDTDANNNCPISDDILLDEPDDGSHGHLNGGHDAGPGKLSLASNNLGSCTGRDAGDGADASHGQPPRRSRRRSKERSESTETRRGSPGHTRHDVHPGSVSSTDAKPKKKKSLSKERAKLKSNKIKWAASLLLDHIVFTSNSKDVGG